MDGVDDRARGGGAEARESTVSQRVYDPESGHDLATAVVEAVADAEGVTPTAVRSPPLYEVVDAAAIEERLFGSKPDGGIGDGTGSVDFRYRGFRVTVAGDGWVTVADAGEADDD